ncbi:MAG: SUMF1/EgtB/PvdO family nonheme iron enzyme [Prolixibacteraceae bacterium]|nr:SUMF1/EgtB/PvdO family nonheme iron enzyme [Prolixibacteraceae bacterium]
MTFKFKNPFKGKKAPFWWIIAGIITCVVVIISTNQAILSTSSDEYCMSCHIHTDADHSWLRSTHHNNNSGVYVHCIECHLPPKGHGYMTTKIKMGAKDIYGYWFKDSADFDWNKKSQLEEAKKYIDNKSCEKCHKNLFPINLSTEGEDAHLNYLADKNNMQCINCHLHVGHYDPDAVEEHLTDFGKEIKEEKLFTEATTVKKFENFTEKIPGTSVSFDMVAIPGGTFLMGSSKKESLRNKDESPVHKVKISGFFMEKAEVSWDEYLAFFRETASQGRKESQETKDQVDAITGPTPPWGAPDQGWGKGKKPAITMTWYAASVYCKWLSSVTGKKYRLPTESEWEYACRGGKQTPYPFKGSAKDYSSKGFMKKIFSPDTSIINSYVIYALNSKETTQSPSDVRSNPFGLKNMEGNVAEFCLDYYSPTAYKKYQDRIVENPKGPSKGREHVIRGGSFKSDAKDVRSASRDYTKTRAWLITDPQMPKSIWWYSDIKSVGFRVVCETEETIEQK